MQVILQVATNARHVMANANAQAFQQLTRADARALQNAGRTDGASAEDDLATCCKLMPGALPVRLHRPCAGVVEQYLVNLNAGQHGEVGAVLDWPQEGLGGVPAHTAALVDLKISTALVVAGVEVIDLADAALLGGIAEGIEDRPTVALAFDPPFTVTTMVLTGAGEVIFAGLEQRQHVLPGPAIVALLGPAVIVGGLAAHVDHAVDRGTATQHLAAWISQCATTQAGLRLGLEAPIGARVADAVEVTDGDVNPGIVVAATRLQQQHAAGRVGGQTIGQQASGGTGPYDHVVEDRIG
ncbi:hypothetical protein D9M71_447930 [compost metagenome]